MKNLWMVQTSGFNTKYLEQTIYSLDRLGIPYKDFGVIQENKIITNLNEIIEPETTYISRGGVLMLDILDNANSLEDCTKYIDKEKDNKTNMEALKKSVDYDEKSFDQDEYKKYELPLLNDSAVYNVCSDILDIKYDKDMFVKPSKDLKYFDGGVMEKGTTIREYIKSNRYRKGYEDQVVLLAPTVQIYAEYRFFIIGKEVITGSLYKRGDQVFPEEYVPENILKKAQEYAALYQPADIFVMDLADTENGVRIVEYNCWNCSGLYAVNAQKLFNEVNEYKKR